MITYEVIIFEIICIGKIIDKIIGRIGKLKYLKGKTLFMQNAKLANKHRFIQSAANLAQRLGTSGLSLGATDFLISGGERKLDPIFFQRTKEEGKTGKELAAARLSNKIKYGKEGAIIGLGFPLRLFSLISGEYSQKIIGFLTKYKRPINVITGLAMLGIAIYYLFFVFKIISF